MQPPPPGQLEEPAVQNVTFDHRWKGPGWGNPLAAGYDQGEVNVPGGCASETVDQAGQEGAFPELAFDLRCEAEGNRMVDLRAVYGQAAWVPGE